jgi:hypothetical protein
MKNPGTSRDFFAQGFYFVLDAGLLNCGLYPVLADSVALDRRL